MASTAAVPFWRSAGMTYISYSNICASLVRNCLKEPYKAEAIGREKVHFSVSKWADGKPEKPSNHSLPLNYHRFNMICWLLRSRVSFDYTIIVICGLSCWFLGIHSIFMGFLFPSDALIIELYRQNLYTYSEHIWPFESIFQHFRYFDIVTRKKT